MTNLKHDYPLSAPVANITNDAHCKAKIPDLTIADFELDYQGVYTLGEMGMATLVQPRRGLPVNMLVHKETRVPIHIVTDEYRPVENSELHSIIKNTLEGMFPTKYLQKVELNEVVENDCSYSELSYTLWNFNFRIQTKNGWETTLSPNIWVKNAAQNAVITIVGAHCSATDNILSLGNKGAISQRHVCNFGPEPIEKHLRYTLLKFPEAAKAMQALADQEINIDQAKNALSMFSKLTETATSEVLQHYAGSVVPEMGANRFSLMTAVADYANNPNAFPVKNSAKADNVAETLATRKKWLAGLVSSSFFFGKGGFYA